MASDIFLWVANVNRRIIAQLEGEIGPTSWRKNDVGRSSLTISKTDPKAIADNLRFGNHVLIAFSNGLPNWGGVIQPPLKWDGSSITAELDSAEVILGWRQTDKGRYFTATVVGTIFSSLVNEANSVSPTGISVGSNTWQGGTAHSPDYHFKDLLQICKESLTGRLEDCDFYLTADESGGYIVYTANLVESRGSDKSETVALIEGHNLTPMRLEQQGPLWNSWDIVGEGTGWGDYRLTAHEENASSISTYGLRQNSAMYPDIKLQATLDSTAAKHVSEEANPHNVWTLEAVNKAPALFSAYDVGDTVKLHSHNFGFGGTNASVKILTREYVPQTDTCRLTVRETT
jgi:hypothetical protein